jgi:transposase
LHRLGSPVPAAAPSATPAAPAPLTLTLSCGDPQRNQNYRAALFGGKQSDPVEARAAARFALAEKPAGDTPLSLELRTLRQVASRLQAVVRQRTRLINQLHHLLGLTFPELALVSKDLAAGWVLELVHRSPTAARLATATATDLATVASLPDQHVATLLGQARTAIASLIGAAAEELVREQVRQLRDPGARQKRRENLLVGAYPALPRAHHLDSMTGIGEVTAAVLTAFRGDLDRFATPGKRVAYFGVLPVEVASGVDRDGQPRGPWRLIMSRRGNDRVRRYLGRAARSAVRHHPAVRAL